MNKIRLSTALVMTVVLVACAGMQEHAGEQHVDALSKWAELAVYSESSLLEYPIAITAQPKIEHAESVQVFRLKNVGLSRSDNPFNIDLLRPNFENKVICNPVCRHVLELHQDQTGSMATLLSTYFSNHEIELFEFYGELYRLNSKVEALREINATRLPGYLNFLASKGEYFPDLSSFLTGFSSALQPERYRNFLENGYVARNVVTAGSLSFPSTPDRHWSSAAEYSASATSKDDADGTMMKPPEMQNWSASSSASEAENWIASDSIRFDHSRGSHQLSNIDEWLLAKNLPIETDDYVCSFRGNEFGVVSRLDREKVIVRVQGQVKQMHDGLISDVEQGALFDASLGELTFVPKNELQTFSLQDLAVCFPQ